MRTLVCVCLLAAASAVTGAQNGSGSSGGGANGAPAGWPGVWGPTRNGTAAPTAAVTPRGFKELWRRATQGGYSEVAVTPRGAFTMEARNGSDDVVAMDVTSGRELWRVSLGPTYRGHDGSHDGPIATPAVDGNDLVALGPHGILLALDATTGKERWRHDLAKAFDASAMIYGFGSSPLIDGRLVIVQTGGAKSRGLLAFDRTDGSLRWHAPHGLRGSYSSPTIGTLAGTRQIIASAGDLVYGVAPEDGRLLWSIKGPGDGESVANPPQVLSDDRVLITFWGEAVLLKIARQGQTLGATEIWRSPRLRGAYSPTIQRGEYLYGFNGPFLSCVELGTGEVKWRHRMYEGTLVGVGAHLFVLGRTSGRLHVVDLSPEAFTEVASAAVLTPGSTAMTGPSVAGTRVFVRNSEEIVALSIQGRGSDTGLTPQGR
jgi:outer membrane protein assembly factor BamB